MSTESGSIQLGFDLQNVDPLSPRYLVVHSGIIEAVEAVREIFSKITLDQKQFFNVVVFGEKGSGKTHLLNVCELEAKQIGLNSFEKFEFSSEDENLIPVFISAYEKTKSEGGVIISSLNTHPINLTNPHLRSRVLSAQVLELKKPKESELREILTSLMERNNFNLSEKAINYIISRVPSSPLSFAAISDKLQETFREQGKSAKFSVVKDLIG